MVTGISGIDHVLVGVRDLEAARRDYERLGFTLTPRGSHIGWGTANYCVMFPDDYVELIGIVDPSQFSNNLDKFLAQREGLMGLAFAASDAAATAAALRRRSIAADGPKKLERRLDLLFFPEGATPGLNAFVCSHLTPELVRRPDWLRHPNGARGLTSITVVVDDPPALFESYEKLLGHGSVTPTDDLITVRLGRHAILFVDPDELSVLHPTADPFEGVEPPYPAAMNIRVAAIDETAAHLKSRGVSFSREADGTLVVPPEAARGLWLTFSVR